ncbi:nucleotidyl transferase AbiEii/AbiGii toxin family protein [Nocardia sp. NPDC050406]|uniref:nucleotidyl transferase AbiEii/AbiGii toxin family protein n=1 Tax=Nocardia sp. NPDC050406 TaxID=3364318 RepID=UPI0037BE00E9
MEQDPGADRAHRMALDHVLALVARSEWGGGLVLRGSTTLRAWFGERARPPADLDWVVPDGLVFPEPLDPFPYVDDIACVQQWPEAADGALEYEMWRAEEFETYGLHPVLPPEELRWMWPEEYEPPSFADDLRATIRSSPCAAVNVLLDGDGVRVEVSGYREYDYNTFGERLVVPWRTTGSDPHSGVVQLDFAFDNTLDDAPVWSAIPRADGGGTTPVVTASRELSLAWKLLWLHRDSGSEDGAAGKDLYDAVLLAECPDTRLTTSLLTKVLGGSADYFTLRRIQNWDVRWDAFRYTNPWVEGDRASWLDRLVAALVPVMTVRR